MYRLMSGSRPARWRRGQPVWLMCCFVLLALTVLAGCGAGASSALRPGTTATPAGWGRSFLLTPQPTPTLNPTAIATATATSAGGVTQTSFPPGAVLPSEARCASSLKRSSFEPRPQNAQANQTVPTAQQIAGLAPWGASMGQDPRADALRKQITGNFTGTTDEILQWAACKWGFDPNLARAEAVVESYWRQNTTGDHTTDQSLCPPGTWDGQGCYQSYGILQIKYTFFKSAWPMARDDTAFSAEYMYGMIRACYEGWTTYLYNVTPLPGYPRYHAGDLWGCVGRWFSGSWYDQGAVDYIQKVKTALANKTWLTTGF